MSSISLIQPDRAASWPQHWLPVWTGTVFADVS